MKIPNKRELQQIAINHSPDIDFNSFKRLYRNFTSEPYSFFVINTTLPLDNSSRFLEKSIVRSKKSNQSNQMMKYYGMTLVGWQQRYFPYHQLK